MTRSTEQVLVVSHFGAVEPNVTVAKLKSFVVATLPIQPKRLDLCKSMLHCVALLSTWVTHRIGCGSQANCTSTAVASWSPKGSIWLLEQRKSQPKRNGISTMGGPGQPPDGQPVCTAVASIERPHRERTSRIKRFRMKIYSVYIPDLGGAKGPSDSAAGNAMWNRTH